MNTTGLENATQENGTIANLEFNLDSVVTNTALFFLAVIPIYIGSFRSLRCKKSTDKEKSVEVVTAKDAAMFPFIASAALFGMYVVFKVGSYLPPYNVVQFVPMQYINYVLKLHFSFMGTCAMSRFLSPIFRPYMPNCIQNNCYKLEFSKSSESTENGSNSEWKLIDRSVLSIETKDFLGTGVALLLGIWYFMSGHWVANNFVAVTIAILAIEFIRLNKFSNGILLLCGLFIYDIFWVFGTGVMVAVAKNLDAPIKVIFPRDFLMHGFYGKQLALLGLGDIVVPGVFIALLLRFDTKLGRKNSCAYFYCGYIAYIVAIITTFVMMHVFKHAQPALLYLVPACLGAPLLMALVKNDIPAMLSYEDEPEPEKTNEADNSVSSDDKKIN
ncbi:unnamed protein product [Trichobilharzia szidati]|nr:unnamed protein product [Trichobilharzia szidati]